MAIKTLTSLLEKSKELIGAVALETRLYAGVNYPRKFFFLRDFSALALLTQKEKFGKRKTPAEPARKI